MDRWRYQYLALSTVAFGAAFAGLVLGIAPEIVGLAAIVGVSTGVVLFRKTLYWLAVFVIGVSLLVSAGSMFVREVSTVLVAVVVLTGLLCVARAITARRAIATAETTAA